MIKTDHVNHPSITSPLDAQVYRCVELASVLPEEKTSHSAGASRIRRIIFLFFLHQIKINEPLHT